MRTRAAWSVGASITVGLVLFALFRLGTHFEGFAAVGAWALVQGLMSLVRIVDAGAAANVTRYIGAHQLGSSPWTTVVAFLLMTTVPVTLASLALAPAVVSFVAGHGDDALSDATTVRLVAATVVFLSVGSAATVVSSALEGMGGLAVRSKIVVFANVLGLVLSLWFVPAFGVVGLTMGYTAISAIQAVCTCVVVRRMSLRHRESIRAPTVGAVWRHTFRETVDLSLVALTRSAFEPAVKAAIAVVSPVATVAIFDLAMKVSTQLRAIGQAAMQPLLLAGATGRGGGRSPSATALFVAADSRLRRSGPLLLGLQLCVWPFASLAGFGSLDVEYLIFSAVLACGATLNLCGLAGFFDLLSLGRSTTLLRIQVLMAVVSAAGCGIAIGLDAALPAVCGYAGAFAFGGLASRRAAPSLARSGTQDAGPAFWRRALEAISLVVALVPGVLVLTESPPASIVGSLLGVAVAAASLLLLLVNDLRRTQ